MPVIRATAPQRDFVCFSLPDIEQEAQDILERAKGQAAKLLEQACQEGRREGFAQGLAEGRSLAQREAINEHAAAISHLMSALNAALGEVQAARETLLLSTAQDATGLAIAIASKVCGQIGMHSSRAAERNVAAALRLTGGARELRLCVHPSDAEYLHSILPELQRRHPALATIDLTADAGVEPGGCQLHTSQGMVDAGIQTQLDRIAADLLGEPGDH